MQSRRLHFIIVVGALALGNLVLALMRLPAPARSERWPVDDAVYAVPGWAVTPIKVEDANGNQYISRDFRCPDVGGVSFSLVTSTHWKSVYQAGADVPFLGAGYVMAPAPAAAVGTLPEARASVARRGATSYLLVHATGERRGLIASDPLRWTLAVADGVTGAPNDYYKLSLTAPLGSDAATTAVTNLARTFFPRIAAWYAH